MYIDPHVHLRDFNECHKETIKHGLEVARDSGLDAVFDMPNTNPPIISRDTVVDRLRIAKYANVPEVYYGIYIGLTANVGQIENAADVYNEFSSVIGMKLFACRSVGSLAVISLEDQMIVYKTLASLQYEGVLVVHAEKESEMHPELWDINYPITHCYARQEQSEVESIKDQIKFARSEGFNGKLHVAHVTSPSSIDLILEAKKYLDISCGVCPHHVIYDWNQMKAPNGILWKMNPPLRCPRSREKIFEHLKAGNIDWIESDHAPHILEEKKEPNCLSGIPGIPWWPFFEQFLRRNNFSEKQIEDLVFQNAAKRFKLNIARTFRGVIDHRNDYVFNPYELVEGKARC